VITRLNRACFLFAFAIAAGSLLAVPLLAEDPATPPVTRPSPLTRQEVWRAVVAELHQRGLSELELPQIEDLDLPAALPAAPGRKLRVLSACSDPVSQRTQFRLECGEPGQCLPFLAYVHFHDGREADSSARAGACRPASEPRLAPEAPSKLLGQTAVRAGDRATAVFLTGRLRIAASVTCLERGRQGEVIRVRSQNGEVFRARISGPDLLEALPQQE